MTLQRAIPLLPELALFALAVLVLIVGIVRRGPAAGWLTLAGLLTIFGLTFAMHEGSSLFRGSFVLDSLAIFAKRLFVASAALSVLPWAIAGGIAASDVLPVTP